MRNKLLSRFGAVALLAASGAAATEDYRGWRTYGGTPEQIRYSSLTQINRDNVHQLEVAWRYDTGEGEDVQTQPIVVDGLLYAYTAKHKAIALDAASGELRWSFDPGVPGSGPNRGVMYWSDGKESRVYAAAGDFLYALQAETGKLITSFGTNGRIDLREHLGRDPQQQSVRLTTPGAVYKDLLIVGGRVGEALPASPGHVRAYDARSGELRWTFHTIPHPGEVGYDTWPKDAWQYSGGANSWPGMSVDHEHGLVFVPTGSAAADFYGANRHGDNLFANSLIALKAETGKRLWHFQFVRHDVLDRDLPAPPALATLRKEGRDIDAVVQTTKQGFVFVFDRLTGQSLFPLREVPVPQSEMPGERTAKTQLLPLKPAPFARQRISIDELTRRTPQAAQWAREQFAKMRSGGPFMPFTVGQDTLVFPGFDGGAEWGGPAFDPQTGLLYVNSNEMAWIGSLAPNDEGRTARSLYLRDCAVCHRDDLKGTPPQIPSLVDIGKRKTAQEISAVLHNGAGRMPSFNRLQPEAIDALIRYLMSGKETAIGSTQQPPWYQDYRFTGYRRFLDPEGYPAIAPPWGTLNAIDLNTGEYVWRIPFGEFPELAARGMKDTGSENYGGPIVTAGGLLFIGATNHDKKFRAFDKANGRLLWETTLPHSANATPATYEIDGRQYVVILATGGKSREKQGGVYVAFRLPNGRVTGE